MRQQPAPRVVVAKGRAAGAGSLCFYLLPFFEDASLFGRD
jgi:hypothetical protein